MKTHKNTDRNKDTKLFNLFKEVLGDSDSAEEAVKDAKKAFLLIRQDAVYKQSFKTDEP